MHADMQAHRRTGALVQGLTKMRRHRDMEARKLTQTSSRIEREKGRLADRQAALYMNRQVQAGTDRDR